MIIVQIDVNASRNMPEFLIAFPIGRQWNMVPRYEMNALLGFNQHSHRPRRVAWQSNEVHSLCEIVQIAFGAFEK